MQLVKVPYTDGVTIIRAANLNDIQDAIIELEGLILSAADDGDGNIIIKETGGSS